LHAKGVNTIAVDFLLARDQADIDKLVAFNTASESLDGFDEKLADQLLFNYVVLFGYREYVDLLFTVWQLNSSLQPNEQKMKITGLAAYQDFSYIQSEEDWEDHDLIRQIIPDQNTMDSFMGKAAIKSLLARPEKSLVFSGVPQAFTAFRQKGFEKHTEDLGYPPENSKRMGNYIYEKAGDRVATVLAHTFFPDRKSYEGVNYPLGGIMEKVDRGLDNIKKRYAFTVANSPFADMEITGEYVAGYTENKEKVIFKDLIYGYIFLNSIKQAELVTPIEGFINDRNLEAARKNFPGPKGTKWSVNQLNGYINGYLGRYTKIKKLFI
jgi:hypothetical protein